jgi:predicted metal-dependent hydrolase
LIGSHDITIEAPPLSNIDHGIGLEAPDGINETSVRNHMSKKQQLLKGTSQMRERSSLGSAGAIGGFHS